MFSSLDQARVVNLMVVARIKKGERLNTTLHHYSIVPSGFIQSVTRFVSGESRSQTISSLTQLVNSCMNRKALKDESEVNSLINLLLDTEKGICNLIYTYNKDITTVSALTLVLNNIEHFIKQYGSDSQLEKFRNQRYFDENAIKNEEDDNDGDIVTEEIQV